MSIFIIKLDFNIVFIFINKKYLVSSRACVVRNDDLLVEGNIIIDKNVLHVELFSIDYVSNILKL